MSISQIVFISVLVFTFAALIYVNSKLTEIKSELNQLAKYLDHFQPEKEQVVDAGMCSCDFPDHTTCEHYDNGLCNC